MDYFVEGTLSIANVITFFIISLTWIPKSTYIINYFTRWDQIWPDNYNFQNLKKHIIWLSVKAFTFYSVMVGLLMSLAILKRKHTELGDIFIAILIAFLILLPAMLSLFFFYIFTNIILFCYEELSSAIQSCISDQCSFINKGQLKKELKAIIKRNHQLQILTGRTEALFFPVSLIIVLKSLLSLCLTSYLFISHVILLFETHFSDYGGNVTDLVQGLVNIGTAIISIAILSTSPSAIQSKVRTIINNFRITSRTS